MSNKNDEIIDHWGLESFKALISFASSFIKGIFIANAGAIGVLLAFAEKNSQDDSRIKNAVVVFVIGVFCAIIVSLCAYIAQDYYTHRKDKFGDISKTFAFIFGTVSLFCFLYGSLIATEVFGPIFNFNNKQQISRDLSTDVEMFDYKLKIPN